MNDVAEVNAKVADSKAFQSPDSKKILDQLRLAISEAISMAAHNAVSEQLQFSITVQAATTQSIAQILSVVEAPVETAAPSNASENSTATPVSALSQSEKSELAGLPDLQALYSTPDEDFSKAFDALLSSFNRALNTIAQDQLSIANALVKQSLQTAIVLKMIESPEKFDAYEKILGKVSEMN